MADRPILFSAPMVRALLDGRKTQTRRVLKPQPPAWCYPDQRPGFSCMTPPGHIEFRGHYVGPNGTDHGPASKFIKLPYAPGDRLWVREAWRTERPLDHVKPSLLPRNVPGRPVRIWHELDRDNCDQHGRYRHARFMPRWASRLTLLVTDVRVQRLQDISEADAQAEGCDPLVIDGAVECGRRKTVFQQLWNSINGPTAWDENPWVTAVTFDVVQSGAEQ